MVRELLCDPSPRATFPPRAIWFLLWQATSRILIFRQPQPTPQPLLRSPLFVHLLPFDQQRAHQLRQRLFKSKSGSHSLEHRRESDEKFPHHPFRHHRLHRKLSFLKTHFINMLFPKKLPLKRTRKSFSVFGNSARKKNTTKKPKEE